MKKELVWPGGEPIKVIKGGLDIMPYHSKCVPALRIVESEPDYLDQLVRALKGSLVLDRAGELPPVIVLTNAPSNACGERPMVVLNRTSPEDPVHNASMVDVCFCLPPDGFIQLDHVVSVEPMSVFSAENEIIGSAMCVITREEAIDSYFVIYPDGSFFCHRHQTERTNSDDPDTA